MTKRVFEMSWRRDHIIERFEAWWKIACQLQGLFEENMEKDNRIGCIFGNSFRFLLMWNLMRIM